MAIVPIVYHPHPALHKVAEPIKDFDQDLKNLVQDMYETMYDAKGIGLAAPQIAISKQIAVIDVSEERNKPFHIINPKIISVDGEELMEEGCLSVPGTYGKVPRALKVTVHAQDENGKAFEITGDGLLAHCLQHEIDHLNGKLYIDHLSPIKRNMTIKKMQKFLRQ